MAFKDGNRMPLYFQSAQYVLTPIDGKTSAKRSPYDVFGASNYSLSFAHQGISTSGTQRNENLQNKSSSTSVPSTSSVSAKEKKAAATKKRKKRGPRPFVCIPCNVRLNTGDIRQHVVGKQHKSKAVPQMSRRCSVTITGFNPNTKEITMFDYFSTFGPVKAMFTSQVGQFVAIQFMEECTVQHVIEYYALHRRNDKNQMNLTVIKGLPWKHIQNIHSLDGCTVDPQKISSAIENVIKIRTEMVRCEACSCEIRADKCREHILGKKHTQKAYLNLRKSHCVTVEGLQHDTSVQSLYDYFSRAGMVISIIIFREKELYAVVEYALKCSVHHVAKCVTPHLLGKTQLFVFRGVPFRENVPDIPSRLAKEISSKHPYPPNSPRLESSENASKAETDGCSKKQKEKGKDSRSICEVCSAVLNVGDRSSHYLSKNHIKKTVPLMKDSCCLTVVGCPPTVTKEEVYEYFNFYENVHTIDMRRAAQGLVTIEFECLYPLKDVVDRVNRLRFGNKMVSVVRGCPTLEVGAQISTVSRDNKKCSQRSQKTAGSHNEPQTTSSAARTLDSLIKNEFEPAMRALCLKESAVKTATENPDASSLSESVTDSEMMSSSSIPNDVATNDSTSHDQSIGESSPDDEVSSKNSTANDEVSSKNSPSSDEVSSKNSTANDEVMSENSAPNDMSENSVPNGKIGNDNSAPNDDIRNQNLAPNNEIKEEPPELKPMTCDICNLFVKPERYHHHVVSKKHNENAMKFLNVHHCITVTGFQKGTTAKNLYDYFSRFGKVTAVMISKNKGRGTLVGFHLARSACNAADADGNLELKGSQLSVKLGYSSIYRRGKPLESLPPHDDLMSSLQKCKTVECQILCLQSSLLLSKDNLEARINLCNSIKQSLRPFFPKCVLHLFGSSVNSFGLKGSDVDMLFEAYPDESDKAGKEEHNKSPNRTSKIKSPNLRDVEAGHVTVQDLAMLPKISQLDFIKKVLRKRQRGQNGFYTVVFVSSTACPIVKFVSKKYALSCDLSNGNRLSLCNTGLLQTFGMLDKRVIPLVTALRYWAKKFHYMSSNNFSSYAFTLMVIFFLQTREPCILPSLEHLRSCTDKKMEVAGVDCSFCSDVRKIKRSTNCETIENLFFEFFNYYGKFDYSQFVISPITGRCELVELFRCSDPSSSQIFKIGAVCIQDPFLVNRNVSSGVKGASLDRMTSHMRKIAREHYYHYQKLKEKSQSSSESDIWGIPQLFEVITKNLRVPNKLLRHPNPFTIAKIILDEVIVNSVRKKYGINCAQCINLSDIVVHEACCLAISVMHMLLFNTEIVFDERNHHDWEQKAKTLGFSCTCAESCSNADDAHDETLRDEDISEGSESLASSSSSDDELHENCLEVNARSSSVSVGTEDSNDSDAEQFSDEESDEKTEKPDVLDTQDSASTKVPEKFDVGKCKPFLSLWFTATHQTWVSRKTCRKLCHREHDEHTEFEVEKCVSQQISQMKSLELKEPAKLKCEFYDYYGYMNPVLYLKVTPPDLKPCWKPLTAYLQDKLQAMVHCLLDS